MADSKRIYPVSWINSYLHNLISQDFLLQSLDIKGEASNVKYHSSGHLYFTLKDEKAAIPVVMFSGDRSGLKFKLEDGMKIVITGRIDLYERDCKAQIYAKKIRLEGAGELYERFEKLKKDLEERGFFAPEYKRPIPKYISTLGVVTASTGAAVRDIINVSKRRNPGIQIILYPAKVQGDGAAESIVEGINALQQTDCEVIIVGRGGGSIEDLWAFNEEIVAEAIFNCETPVISAVGHETDFTIADFVSDLRAPTPSAAAELAVSDVSLIDMNVMKARFDEAIDDVLEGYRGALELYKARFKALSPEAKLNEKRMHLLNIEQRFEQSIDDVIKTYRYALSIYAERLDGVSPLKRMSTGYAYVQGASGMGLKSVKDARKGDEIKVHFVDGFAEAEIKNVTRR